MIRNAETKDIESIVKLHIYLVNHLVSLKPERYTVSNKEANIFKQKLERIFSDKNALVLVYEENKRVLGYAIGRIKDYPPLVKFGKYGEFDEIVLDKKIQGKGIAKELSDKLMNFFKSKKVKIVEGLIDSNNNISLNAFKKLGFEEEMKIVRKFI